MNKDKRLTATCLQCSKEFKYSLSRSTGKYCSNNCCSTHRHSKYVTAWDEGKLPAISTKSGRLHQGIRRILLNSAGNKCSQCGWNEINSTSNNCPLEVDHIDGNSANCDPINLRVLCPNCHSLTPTYRALNRGNGNRSRLSYSKLIPPNPLLLKYTNQI